MLQDISGYWDSASPQIGAFSLIAATVWLLFFLPYTIRQWCVGAGNVRTGQYAVLLAGICILGSAAGTAGGLSRESVVGDIIPAIFTFLGGVSLYLFGKEPERGVGATVLASALAISLVGSYSFAAQVRHGNDEWANIRDRCADMYFSKELLKAGYDFPELYKSHPMAMFCHKYLLWKVPN